LVVALLFGAAPAAVAIPPIERLKPGGGATPEVRAASRLAGAESFDDEHGRLTRIDFRSFAKLNYVEAHGFYESKIRWPSTCRIDTFD
jgi:hypothetical protein